MTRAIKQEYLIEDKGSGTVKKATNSINSSLNSVEKKSGSVSKVMVTNWKAIATGIGAVVVVAAAAIKAIQGVVNFGNSVIDLADKLDKMSIRLGIGVNELDRLRRVSELAGIEFNVLGMALQRMSRRAADAAQGLGSAKDAFKELGINAKELIKLPLEEQLITIANAVNNVENSSDKLRLTFKILDSGGAALLQTFGGLEEQYRKTLSAFSAERVAVAVAFKDTMAILQHTMQDLAITLMPAFLSILIQLEPYLKQFGEFLGVKSIDAQIIDTIDDIAKATEKLTSLQEKGWLANLKWQASQAGGTGMGGAGIGGSRAEQAKKTAKQIENLNIKLQKLQNLQNTMDAMAAKRAAGGDVGSSVAIAEADQRPKLIQAYVERLKLQGKFEESEIESVREQYRIKIAAAGTFMELRKTLEENMWLTINGIQDKFAKERYDKAVKAYEDSVKLEEKKAKDVEKALDKYFKDIDEAEDTLREKTKERLAEIQGFIDRVAESFSAGLTDGIMQFIDGTKSASDAMRDFAVSFLKEMSAMIIKTEIFNAVQAAGSYLGGSGGIIGGIISGLAGARADGGPVAGGSSYLVGEKGPEIFTPGQSGNITPNGGGGGGGSVTQINNINIESGAAGTPEQDQALALKLDNLMTTKFNRLMGDSKRFGGMNYAGGIR